MGLHFGNRGPQHEIGAVQRDKAGPAPVRRAAFFDRALMHISNRMNQNVDLVEIRGHGVTVGGVQNRGFCL